MKKKLIATLFSLALLSNMLFPLNISAADRSNSASTEGTATSISITTPTTARLTTPTPTPTEAPSDSFQAQDQQWSQMVQSSTGTSGGASSPQETKPDNGTDSNGNKEPVDRSKSYNVKFKDSASLTDINGCVSKYTYKLLGKSDLRLFNIQLDDVQAFQNTYAAIVETVDQDQAMSVSAVPNDTYYSQQWALPDMKLPQAWDITKGNTGVKVAVIDTGYYRGIMDFNDSLVLPGYDVTGGHANVTSDTVGHGTMVSSVIGAETNNGYGMAGTCWNAMLVPYKVDSSDGHLYDSDVITALNMAADSGCDVINMSFGGYTYDSALNTAIQYASDKGCILVAAAGNEGTAGNVNAGKFSYPASYGNVVSVAAVDSNNQRASFSQYNNSVDVTAPGKGILVLDPDYEGRIGQESWVLADGTSFSSPYVAGIAALAKTIDKNITSHDFMNSVSQTCTDLGIPDQDSYYGCGLINAQALLNYVMPTSTQLTVDPATGVITGYSSVSPDLVIPEQINGVTITGIGDNAIYNCVSLQTVSILGTHVTSIGNGAFNGCSNLKSIILPDSVISLGKYAFFNCPSLKEVKLPKNITQISEDLFRYCRNLSEIDIPYGVTSIGDGAFDSCDSLQTVTLPSTLTTIGHAAFRYSAFLSVAIPDSVTTINSYAFGDCCSLQSITIPDSVTSLGYDAFSNCDTLKTIKLSKNITSIPENLFAFCSSLTSINIPYGVKVIEDGAFYGCNSLLSVIIPGSVTKLDRSFYNCSSLLSIVIPDSVASITSETFCNDSKLAIYGGSGSTAQSFASANNVPFKEADFTLTGITMKSAPAQKSYEGQSLNLTGAMITASHADGTNADIPVTADMVFGYDANKTGTQTLTVDYKGYITTFDITVYSSSTTPQNVTAAAGDGKVTLTWDPVYNATAYAVAYQNGSSWATLTTSCSDTAYTATNLVSGKYYIFVVQAKVNGNWSSFNSSNYVAATPTGATKPTVRVTGVGDGCVSLQWSPVSGATQYAVSCLCEQGYTTFVTDSTQTSGTVTGLVNNKVYAFLVQSYADGKWSSFSSADLVIGIPTDANRPVVKAAAGDGSATLTWDAIPGATAYAVAYQNGSGGWTTLTTTCTDDSYAATNLVAGKTYTFLVQAKVNGNWSKFDSTNYVTVTPTGATKPTATVAAVGDGFVTLNWNAVSGATKYAIQYQNGSSWVTLTTSCTDTTYTAANLVAGKTYTFLVQSYADGKWSSFNSSDYVNATPTGATKPTATVTAVGNGSVTLNWNAVSGATAYAIQYQNGSSWVTFTTSCTDTTYTAANLVACKTYTFLVQSYADGKWSSFSSSDLVTATPAGATKPTATVTSVGDRSVTLNWNAVSGATKYAIAYQNGSSWVTLSSDWSSTICTVSGLTNHKQYTFLIQSYADGKWSSFSSSDYVTGTPIDPNRPVIKAVAGNGSATLTWDAIPGATAYAIAYQNGSGWTTLTTSCTGTTYTATSLVSGKTYAFLVQAKVNGNWSKFDYTDYATATPTGATKPTATVAAVGVGSVTFNWNAVSGATKYAIQYQNGSSWVTLTTSCTGTTYTATGLTNHKQYTFLVQSYADGKWSNFSSSDYVTGIPIDPNRPVVKAAAGNGSATLTWDAIPGATAYAIQYQNGSGWTTLTTNCTDTTYTATNLVSGKTYTFLVQAKINGSWSKFDSTDYATVTPTGK